MSTIISVLKKGIVINMEWRIEQCEKSQTVEFAAWELAKYLGKMDPNIFVAVLKPEKQGQLSGTLKLQVGDYDGKLVKVNDPNLDDAYYIDVVSGRGVIAGTNERSVLFGVYRFLRELGCRWLRPGDGGEIIPQKDVSSCSVRCGEAASYRHRGVCIEGACSFAHVADMVDWLPKIGMNAYFNQFTVPFTFFDQWYQHTGNPYMQPEPVSVEEVRAMVNTHIHGIRKRGMLYHATGHGWTCEPLGIEGNSWDEKDYFVPDGIQELFALVNGERSLFGGIPLNTNLCYSNQEVQQRIVSAIVDYCRSHNEVDYLHFWLADEMNNHCECERCQEAVPADFYVRMLNEIDRRLTKEKIETKIVFLIYYDLLWEPQVERLKNQDRFVLMFAPISRTYSASFCKADEERPEKLEPYARNKLIMPKRVEDNIKRLNAWQDQFSGDSFIYDYHLIWPSLYDLGGYITAKVLFNDMKELGALGLNGMISCQMQRVFLPTGLSMYAMAEALWNKNLQFEEVAAGYYADLFGGHGEKIHAYLKNLSCLCEPSYLSGEKPAVSEECALKFSKIISVVNEMMPFLFESLERECNPCRKKTWSSLVIHGQLCIYMANTLTQSAEGNFKQAMKHWEATKDYLNRMEPDIHELFDVRYFNKLIDRAFDRIADIQA